MTFQKPKGTVDFFPGEYAARTKIFSIWKETAVKYGYEQVESPAFETLDVLTKKEGDEIVSQIFTLEQRGSEKFGLKFDLTVPMARMFLEKQKTIQKPVKWFMIDKMWRYEQPQAGRLREFFQISVECYGTDTPESDAEMLCITIDLLRNCGLALSDFYVRLSSRKVVEAYLRKLAADADLDKLFAIIDKKQKISSDEFEKLMKDAGLAEQDVEKLEKFLAIKELSDVKGLGKDAEDAIESLKATLSYLGERSSCVRIDLSTVRGLSYYTGIVFEVFDSNNKYRALAGGGRYDRMVKNFGGQECAAVGFAMGYATLSLFLKDKGLLSESVDPPEYFIAVVSDTVRKDAFAVADALRKTATVEMDVMSRKLARQLQYANAIGAKKVVFVGEDELKQGKVKVKDMESGKETLIPISELTRHP